MENQQTEIQKLKENTPNEPEEELITDFSQMFKGKGFIKKPPKLSSRPVEQIPNWLLEIPAKIQLTKEELGQRKVLDQRRWKSMTKAITVEERIVAAVTSSWNYLFSLKGVGNLPALTVKNSLQIFNRNGISYIYDPQSSLNFDLMRKCFQVLCQQFKVHGKQHIIYKPNIPNKVQVTAEIVLQGLLRGLKSTNKSYVLITFNNILCPIGFDNTPLVPLDAYKKLEDIKPQNTELWIINGSTVRTQPSFVSKRWKHIKESLETVWPNYIDLDEPKKGALRYADATEQNEKEEKGNEFYLIQFVKE